MLLYADSIPASATLPSLPALAANLEAFSNLDPWDAERVAREIVEAGDVGRYLELVNADRD